LRGTKAKGIKLCTSTVARQGKDDPDTKSNVEDILLYAYTINALLQYFEVVLKIFKHYQVLVKLWKCRFIQTKAKFVGMDIHSQGNTPAKSNDKVFQKMTYPRLFAYFGGFIAFVGFYQEFITLYKVQIDPFWKLLKNAPCQRKRKPVYWNKNGRRSTANYLMGYKLKPALAPCWQDPMTKKGSAYMLEQEWKEEYSQLFDMLRTEASSGPMLAGPNNKKVSAYIQTGQA
jgi:hypothetical protein